MEWGRGGQPEVIDGAPTSDEGLRTAGGWWTVLPTRRVVSGCSCRAQKTVAIARHRGRKFHDCRRYSLDRGDVANLPRMWLGRAWTRGRNGL